MFLFFDTETTGLPKSWSAPMEKIDNWPRVVQLAWLLYDEKEQKISENNFIIKPEGFSIPEDSSRVHGITDDRAKKDGRELAFVLEEFSEDIRKANFLIAHNINFDEKVIGAEFIRKNLESFIPTTHKICTMNSSIDFCKIPSSTSYGYKYPKLSELHFKLFGKDFEDAHDALVDTTAMVRCFFELKKQGVIKLPEVEIKEKVMKQGNLF